MSDTPQTQPPGWYYAQGDPPGTQRYWDGQRWEGGPQPVPGASQDVAAGAVPGLAEPVMRIGARLIDYVVWAVPYVFFSLIFGGLSLASGDSSVSFVSAFLAAVLAAGAVTGYETYMVGSRGQTLGKMALGLKVVREDGSAPDMKDGFMRILPFAILGFLAAFISLLAWLIMVIVAIVSLVFLFTDPKRQAAWDRVAKTVVVTA